MKLTFVFLLGFVCAHVAFAQVPPRAPVPSSKVFERMDKEVRELDSDIKKTDAKAAARPAATGTSAVEASATLKVLVQETDNNVAALKKLAQNRPVPTEYKASIDDSAEQLKQIRKKARYTFEDVAQVRAINEDLQIKRTHAESRPNAPFESIKINVHTKKNGQETGVYQIWWVQNSYKDKADKYQTFDTFSSPTSRLLPPGKYWMWTKATDGSGATGEKTPKEFGDGKAEIDTDLIAP